MVDMRPIWWLKDDPTRDRQCNRTGMMSDELNTPGLQAMLSGKDLY